MIWLYELATAILAIKSRPVKLIVPANAEASQAWWYLAIVLAALAVLLFAASLLALWLGRRTKHLAIDPLDRAATGLCIAAGLNSSQRKTLDTLAAALGPHTSPAALILSRTALRRAVASALEAKPDPSQTREIQKLIQRLVSDFDDSQTAAPKIPPAKRSRAFARSA